MINKAEKSIHSACNKDLVEKLLKNEKMTHIKDVYVKIEKWYETTLSIQYVFQVLLNNFTKD